jgi:hypothetical protein
MWWAHTSFAAASGFEGQGGRFPGAAYPLRQRKQSIGLAWDPKGGREHKATAMGRSSMLLMPISAEPAARCQADRRGILRATTISAACG